MDDTSVHPVIFRFLAVSAQSVTSTSIKRSSTVGQPSPALSSTPNSVKFEKKNKKNKPNKKEKPEKNGPKMTTNLNEPSLKDLSHPSFNDQLKAYNTATFKLVKTGKQIL